jgi:DNA-binding MarR family transcriptional regulator
LKRNGDIATAEYQTVAELRAALRYFLSETDKITRRHGLTPSRYDLLVMIRGAANGEATATVGELADRLRITRHAASELVERAAAADLVRRERSTEDARVVEVRLTEKGERQLQAAVAELAPERRRLLQVLTAIARTGRQLAAVAPSPSRGKR